MRINNLSPGALPDPTEAFPSIPTIVPDPYVHEYQASGETGKRTLW